MNRIDAVFQKAGARALIPYLTVGYPAVETTVELALWLARNGADIIELGIPFSDPLADGATIQASSYKALLNGVTAGTCLEVASTLRKSIETPLVFMTYFNPVLHYGIPAFCRECRSRGVDGLIVPDLPPGEAEDMEGECQVNDLDLIYLLSPNSTAERIALVAEKSRGFIYLVSVTGVTGAREQLQSNLGSFVAAVRKATGKPLCLGFGIAGVAQAREAAKMADGVILGSRLVQLIDEDPSGNRLHDFFRELRRGLNS
jgi:tryptophan synthase alpha chain